MFSITPKSTHRSRTLVMLTTMLQCSLHSVWRRPSNATPLRQPPKELDLSHRLLKDCPSDLLVELGIMKVINSSWVGDISLFSDILSSKGNNALLICLFIGFIMPIIQGRFFKGKLL